MLDAPCRYAIENLQSWRDYEKSGGVYAIENMFYRAAYIGSTHSFWYRWYGHRSKLSHGTHENSRLQMDWDIRGAGSFKFVPLEVICGFGNQTTHMSREQYWFETIQAMGYEVYNFVSPEASKE